MFGNRLNSGIFAFISLVANSKIKISSNKALDKIASYLETFYLNQNIPCFSPHFSLSETIHLIIYDIKLIQN